MSTPGRAATDEFDPDEVPVRPAATVMLLRDGSDGLEVFMLERTAGAAFGAGMYVFPGGRVDRADDHTELETLCVGHGDASASARLGIDRGGLAYWVAAVRECFEEAGVLLASGMDGGGPAVTVEDRYAVHDGSMSLVELCRRESLRLDLTDVHYVDHWVTPRGEVRRFDTRFFVAAAPPGQEPVHDDHETVASRWLRPADALTHQADGSLVMMPPTIANLSSLAAHDSVAAAMVHAAARPRPRRTLPKLRRGPDGAPVGVSMPDDPDYDDLP